MNLFLCVFMSVISVFMTTALVFMTISMRKTDLILSKAFGAPAKPGSAPTGVPQYLTYEQAFKLFDKFITLSFQRSYTNEVLPSLTNSARQINKLAPSDKNYSKYIESITVQVIANVPQYLNKSVLYYFGITQIDDMNKVSENKNYPIYVDYIVSKIKGMMDSKIVEIGQRIEKDGNSADPVLSEYSKLGKTILGIKDGEFKSPDGSEATIVD